MKMKTKTKTEIQVDWWILTRIVVIFDFIFLLLVEWNLPDETEPKSWKKLTFPFAICRNLKSFNYFLLNYFYVLTVLLFRIPISPLCVFFFFSLVSMSMTVMVAIYSSSIIVADIFMYFICSNVTFSLSGC